MKYRIFTRAQNRYVSMIYEAWALVGMCLLAHEGRLSPANQLPWQHSKMLVTQRKCVAITTSFCIIDHWTGVSQ